MEWGRGVWLLLQILSTPFPRIRLESLCLMANQTPDNDWVSTWPHSHVCPGLLTLCPALQSSAWLTSVSMLSWVIFAPRPSTNLASGDLTPFGSAAHHWDPCAKPQEGPRGKAYLGTKILPGTYYPVNHSDPSYHTEQVVKNSMAWSSCCKMSMTFASSLPDRHIVRISKILCYHHQYNNSLLNTRRFHIYYHIYPETHFQKS